MMGSYLVPKTGTDSQQSYAHNLQILEILQITCYRRSWLKLIIVERFIKM